MSNKIKVLVTGVTGFLGSHITIQLLEKGYTVIGTLRDMNRADKTREVIASHTNNADNLSFVEADLLNDKIWNEIMDGIDYVMHVASPFPSVLPKKEEELIIPAKQGTLNVLTAASNAGVKKVVLTSSSAAIIYGKEKSNRSGLYSENDWTDLTNRKDTTPYIRSKTMAERAAWDFIEKDTSGLELTTICPGAILGPVLEEDLSASANIVVKTMDGSSPAIPKIGYEIVDVRSVADLHIRAMESNRARGERLIASAGYLTFRQVADILREKYPDRKIPQMKLPNFMTKFISNFEKSLKPILLDLDIQRKMDNSRAKVLLNWEPISAEEAVIACAESVIRLNIV